MFLTLAAPIPKETKAYSPTSVGDTWKWGQAGGQLSTYAVTKVEGKLVHIGRLSEGQFTPYQVLRVTADEVAVVSDVRKPVEPPAVLVRTSAKPGDTWKRTYPLFPGEVTVTHKGVEDVEVPAGKFRCLRVEVTRGKTTWTEWHAPGLGMVRNRAAGRDDLVLTEFTPKK